MVFTSEVVSTEPTPIHVIRMRDPYVWKNVDPLYPPKKELNGELVANDDALLDDFQEEQFLKLDTFQELYEERGVCRGTRFEHVIYYKEQPVWRLQTESSYNIHGTWGQSSTCVMHRGRLRVVLLHKGRRSNGEGYHTVEKRIYSLAEIIRKSGQLRQQQFETTTNTQQETATTTTTTQEGICNKLTRQLPEWMEEEPQQGEPTYEEPQSYNNNGIIAQ